ncbi:hypothetical protein ACIQZM_15900 [Peribacillus sp. NPDC097206]|uniref:hypothetical protein n=1 Tax=unclassified Peribacillus TaxID=2675266 RepID=UPI0037F1AED6
MDQSNLKKDEKQKREDNLVGGEDFTTQQLLNGMNGISEIYRDNSDEDEKETTE